MSKVFWRRYRCWWSVLVEIWLDVQQADARGEALGGVGVSGRSWGSFC
jgi:hypothetical protein